MKRIIIAGIIALGLSGCTAAQVSQTGTDVQQGCVSIAPVVAAGAASGNPTAQSIAGYANAVCGPIAAGSTPATVNSSTPTWLGNLAGMINALLPVAVALL